MVENQTSLSSAPPAWTEDRLSFSTYMMPILEETMTKENDKQETAVVVIDEAPARRPRAAPVAASVKINVEGAFIVDDETNVKNGAANEHVHWEHKDIRLPHHTDVVSHVAVDVCHYRSFYRYVV